MEKLGKAGLMKEEREEEFDLLLIYITLQCIIE